MSAKPEFDNFLKSLEGESNNTKTPPLAASPSLRASIASRVRFPAIVLLVLSLCSLAFHGWHLQVLSHHVAGPDPAASQVIALMFFATVGMIVLRLVMVMAFIMAMQLKSLGLVKLATVASMAPLLSPGIILGIPFAILLNSVLRQPQTKDAFNTAG